MVNVTIYSSTMDPIWAIEYFTMSMGIQQDPKLQVRKRTICLAIEKLWGYSLKFRPNK